LEAFYYQYDGRKVLNRDVFETIKHLKSEVFKTKVRDIALAEAAQGQDIFRYNAKSNGAEDYMALAKEIINVSKHSNINIYYLVNIKNKKLWQRVFSGGLSSLLGT
jgi:hypothetical protein